MTGSETESQDGLWAVYRLLDQGEVEAARIAAGDVLQADHAEPESAERGRALLALARCDLALGCAARAHDGAASAASILGATGACEDEIRALAFVARVASRLGRSVEAVEAALLATLLDDGQPKGIWSIEAYCSLGIAYGWGHSHANAARAFETAQELASRLGTPHALTETLFEQALCEWFRVSSGRSDLAPEKRTP